MRKEDQIYSLTRKYILGFTDIFNDTFVIRYNDKKQEISYKMVPVFFPGGEKYLTYEKNIWQANKSMNPEAIFELAKTLPSIFIGDFSIKRDLSNQHNKFELVKGINKKVYTPVAYKLEIKVTVMTNLFDDLMQILEQILPIFAPTYNININPIPGIIENESVPISADDPQIAPPYDLDREGQRIWTAVIPFSIGVNYYPEYYTLIVPTTTLEVE